MQPEWLRRYFQHEHDGHCGHQGEAPSPAKDETAPDGVSRRDFVKSSFVAGVAAGAAAGSMVAQTTPAQAQRRP